MSRSVQARFARQSTSWLLLVLCIALLAWRIDYRIEQCHSSHACAPAVVAYFDANERNVVSPGETNLDLHTRADAESYAADFNADGPAAHVVAATERTSGPPENPPVVAGSFIQSFASLPKPPPGITA